MFSKLSTTRYAEKRRPIEMKAGPLISIVTPVYNAADYILQTIESVRSQSYKNWQLLLIDDCSTDESERICREMLKMDPRIHYERLSVNKGAAFCRNRATDLANGEYIAFLDSDDLWAPEKLEVQLNFMQNEFCSVSFTSYLQIDELGNPLGKRIIAIPILSYEKQHSNNYIGNLTGMYHVGKIGKVYSTDLRKRQDWALWLECIKRSGFPARGINQDLAFYRIRKGSMSKDKLQLLKYNFQFYRKHLGYSFPRSFVAMGKFFIEYFFVRPKYIEKVN